MGKLGKLKGMFVDKNGHLRIGRILLLIVSIAVVLLIIFGTIVMFVPAGHKAVMVNGPNTGKQYDEGVQFKNPFSTRDYVRYNIQETVQSVSVLTNDGYNVPVDFQVTYRLDKDHVGDIRVDNPDYKSAIIINNLRSDVRTVISDWNYTGEEINTKRSTVEIGVYDKLSQTCGSYHIIIESVSVRNVNLPETILNATEQRASAEISVQTAEYELMAEQFLAQKKIVRARAEANSTILLAGGQAKGLAILAAQAENMSDAGGNMTYVDMMNYILTVSWYEVLEDPDSNIEYLFVIPEGQPIIIDLSQYSSRGGYG